MRWSLLTSPLFKNAGLCHLWLVSRPELLPLVFGKLLLNKGEYDWNTAGWLYCISEHTELSFFHLLLLDSLLQAHHLLRSAHGALHHQWHCDCWRNLITLAQNYRIWLSDICLPHLGLQAKHLTRETHHPSCLLFTDIQLRSLFK